MLKSFVLTWKTNQSANKKKTTNKHASKKKQQRKTRNEDKKKTTTYKLARLFKLHVLDAAASLPYLFL